MFNPVPSPSSTLISLTLPILSILGALHWPRLRSTRADTRPAGTAYSTISGCSLQVRILLFFFFCVFSSLHFLRAIFLLPPSIRTPPSPASFLRSQSLPFSWSWVIRHLVPIPHQRCAALPAQPCCIFFPLMIPNPPVIFPCTQLL